MPKTKLKLKYNKKYTEENIQKALTAVKNGMPKKKAAEIYSVPRSTLQFRLSKKFSKTTLGPSPFLTKDEEIILVEWINECVRKGFPRRKEDLLATVKDFFDRSGRPNPFKDNYPGKGWYSRFLVRHPELSRRTPEGVTSASANVSSDDIKGWFKKIEEYLWKKNLQGILDDPSRVYNGDESNFQLCPKQKTVLAPKGCKNVYEVEQGQAKSTLTVMFTFGANGDVTPPMIIFPLKRMTANIQSSVPTEWGIGLSDNGWMKAELFYEYISNVLHPFLKNKGVQFPIILFVDGHKTHLSYKLSNLCSSLKIVLIALYPNSTRILQPADVSAFKPIKSGWKDAVYEWRRKNPFDNITKEKFAPILKIVVENIKTENIISGFRACGLYPWNKEAIDYSKCLGKVYSKVVDKPLESKEREKLYPDLSYKQFQEIVGNEKFDELKKFDPRTSHFEDFLALHKIFSHFQKTEKQNEIPPNYAYSESYNCNMEQDEVNEDLTITDISLNQELLLVETNLNEILHKADDGPSTSCENNDVFDIGSLPVFLFDDSEAENSNTNIQNIIQWPLTPERKGKKNVEKLPYVITSSGWKQIQESKIQEKRKQEEDKEVRKMQRLKKKQEKESKKPQKTSSKQTIVKKQPSTIKKRTYNVKSNDDKNKDIDQKETERKLKTNKMDEFERNNKEEPQCKKSENKYELEDNCHDLTVKTVAVTEKFTHIRNIFGEEVSLSHNKKADPGALCFVCTFPITNNWQGVKCFKCVRTYHISCTAKAMKHNENCLENVFFCKTCSPPN